MLHNSLAIDFLLCIFLTNSDSSYEKLLLTSYAKTVTFVKLYEYDQKRDSMIIHSLFVAGLFSITITLK